MYMDRRINRRDKHIKTHTQYIEESHYSTVQ